MSVNLGQCIVTLLGHNWDLNSILLFKLLHFNFEWIVFCDLVSCKDNFILHKSDFSCLIWQCWNISGTTMWPQAIGTTSHPNFGMHTGSQGPNPAIFSQNCPNRAMLPGISCGAVSSLQDMAYFPANYIIKVRILERDPVGVSLARKHIYQLPYLF